MSMTSLMAEIESTLAEGGQWCSPERAHTLAAIVCANRPRQIVEIGVWMGGSAIPMLCALRHVARHTGGAGQLLAIDPWSPAASIEGQTDANRAWWGNQDHERAYQAFCARLHKHEVTEFCRIERVKSDDAATPPSIDLLSIDGNHGEQAIRDVRRFAANVPVGGILAIDDLDWSEGAVERAHALAVTMGFLDLYPLGTGVIMRRATRGL